MRPPTCCRIASSATFVLPAPVGAHTSMFSFECSAVSTTADCSWLSDCTPPKASCANCGSDEIGTRAPSSRAYSDTRSFFSNSPAPLRFHSPAPPSPRAFDFVGGTHTST